MRKSRILRRRWVFVLRWSVCRGARLMESICLPMAVDHGCGPLRRLIRRHHPSNSSIPQYRLHLRSALQPEALPNQRRSSPWRHRQRTRLKNVLLQPSGEQVQLTPGLTGSLAW